MSTETLNQIQTVVQNHQATLNPTQEDSSKLISDITELLADVGITPEHIEEAALNLAEMAFKSNPTFVLIEGLASSMLTVISGGTITMEDLEASLLTHFNSFLMRIWNWIVSLFGQSTSNFDLHTDVISSISNTSVSTASTVKEGADTKETAETTTTGGETISNPLQVLGVTLPGVDADSEAAPGIAAAFVSVASTQAMLSAPVQATSSPSTMFQSMFGQSASTSADITTEIETNSETATNAQADTLTDEVSEIAMAAQSGSTDMPVVETEADVDFESSEEESQSDQSDESASSE